MSDMVSVRVACAKHGLTRGCNGPCPRCARIAADEPQGRYTDKVVAGMRSQVRGAFLGVLVLFLAAVTGCGDGAGERTHGIASSPTPTVTSTVSPQGQVYSDADSGWTLEYPHGFLFEKLAGRAAFAGELYVVRFFDERFRDKEPLGQVEVVMYTRDVDDLGTWLDRHSGTRDEPDDPRIYFRDVKDLRSAELASRTARAFTWDADEIGAVYTIVSFLAQRVFRINYFCSPDYCSTMNSIFDTIVASVEFQG